MCNCGRKSNEVITSAQAQEDQAARAAQDYAANEEQRVQSASNALANASTGWFAVEQPA
jgi:hypothetical protein